jgi:hypothetical protein
MSTSTAATGAHRRQASAVGLDQAGEAETRGQPGTGPATQAGGVERSTGGGQVERERRRVRVARPVVRPDVIDGRDASSAGDGVDHPRPSDGLVQRPPDLAAAEARVRHVEGQGDDEGR